MCHQATRETRRHCTGRCVPLQRCRTTHHGPSDQSGCGPVHLMSDGFFTNVFLCVFIGKVNFTVGSGLTPNGIFPPFTILNPPHTWISESICCPKEFPFLHLRYVEEVRQRLIPNNVIVLLDELDTLL